MIKQSATQFFSLRKTVLLGVLLLFLIFVVGCEFFHSDFDCNIHVILTRLLFSKEIYLFYSSLLFSLIVVNLFASLKKDQRFSFFLNPSSLPFLIFLHFQEFISKIFDPFLRALKLGIIHPKIYNLNTISG